jgi:phosphoribosylformylglycinamidine synthase
VALAESCLGGKVGAEINLSPEGFSRLDRLLFGEAASRIIVSVSSEHQLAWENYLLANIPDNWQKLGQVTSSHLQIRLGAEVVVDLPLEAMMSAWSNAIERRLS